MILTPMKYSQFTVKAAIDFLEFEIRTTAKTQAVHIHNAGMCSAVRVVGCDESTGVQFAEGKGNTTTSVFRLQIQDPARLHELKALFVRIACKLDLHAPPTLTAMEIALDTYCKGATIRQLAEIAADRYRFWTHVPRDEVAGDGWHFYRRKGEGRHYINEGDYAKSMNRAAIIRHFEEGWQLTDCNDKGADVRAHAYVKIRDRNRSLLPSEYRARFELTLQGAALPCRTLEDLERFSFVKLADRFKFRRFSDDLHPAARWALARLSGRQLGRAGRYRRKHKTLVGRYSGTSVFRSSTVADNELNGSVYEFLRQLSRHWRSKRGQTSDTGECGFSGRIGQANPRDYREGAGRLVIQITSKQELPIHSAEIRHNDSKEAQRADQAIDSDEPGNDIPDPGSRCSPPITDDAATTVMNSSTGCAGDKAQRAAVALPFQGLFNHSPEMDAEQDKIDVRWGRADPSPS